MKQLHLICNAHLDPCWHWEWEEGAAATVATFRCAADFCEEFDGFVFNHNEAVLYEWIEEYDKELFKRIQALVAAGKWNIMGGWYIQPDCNMLSGESFLRQIERGHTYFKEKFGVADFKTVWNADPFGFGRGLVQIMAKTGYENFVFMRPDSGDLNDLGQEFYWVGYDGSRVLSHHIWAGYGNALGGAAPKINSFLDQFKEFETAAVFWGVGNHGGGPSRKDLRDIDLLMQKQLEQGIEVIHSSPDQYFQARKEKASVKTLPEYKNHLRTCNPGCYTSQIRIKQTHRKLENLLLLTEKIASAADAAGLCSYPYDEFSEAEKALLFAQFHDVLPGSSVEIVEQSGLRIMNLGIEKLIRIRTRSLFALASLLPKAAEGEIPVVVFNPHPYTVDTTLCCEFTLADHNFDSETVMVPAVYHNGNPLPSQLEKEAANTNLDWRKRVVFDAKLEPMQIQMFSCRLEKQLQQPGPQTWCTLPPLPSDSEDIHGSNLDLLNGEIVLSVYQDIPDSWGMGDYRTDRLKGRFSLASPERAAEICGVKSIEPVHVIENGEVRKTVEKIYVYHRSCAVIKWTMYRNRDEIDCNIRLFTDEKDALITLDVPLNMSENARFLGQDAFGTSELAKDGNEQVSLNWVAVTDDQNAFAAINDGTYASHYKDGKLSLNLIRTPAYTCHPIMDRELLPQDRFIARIDQGENVFDFQFVFGEQEEVLSGIDKKAQLMQEKPVALSMFPGLKTDNVRCDILKLPDDTPVVLTSLRKQDDQSYAFRLYNPSGTAQSLRISSPLYQFEQDISVPDFEVETYLVGKDGLEKTMLIRGERAYE